MHTHICIILKILWLFFLNIHAKTTVNILKMSVFNNRIDSINNMKSGYTYALNIFPYARKFHSLYCFILQKYVPFIPWSNLHITKKVIRQSNIYFTTEFLWNVCVVCFHWSMFFVQHKYLLTCSDTMEGNKTTNFRASKRCVSWLQNEFQVLR